MTIQQTISEICKKEPFFTDLVLELNVVKDNSVPTLGTDGSNLIYNPKFFNSLKDSEKCGVVLHEILHCSFLHMFRIKDRDMQKWNIATDYAINPIVVQIFKLPKGCLIDSKYYGLSAEEIYDKLPKNKTKKQSWCDKGEWVPSNGGKESNTQKIKKIFSKGHKKRIKDKTERDWEQIAKKVFTEKYSSAPDYFKRFIEKNFYVPTIDWTLIVRSLLSEDINDYSFDIPDRRFLESDFILPDQSSRDKLKDVVFAYDTSGSISEEDLTAFYHETMELLSNFPSLQGWATACDAYIHSFQEINSKMGKDEINFQGGGGTDFEPVFEEITEREIKPKGVFYFTDLMGIFPRVEPSYPVFWLVRCGVGENYGLQPPFGEVIRFLRK